MIQSCNHNPEKPCDDCGHGEVCRMRDELSANHDVIIDFMISNQTVSSAFKDGKILITMKCDKWVKDNKATTFRVKE